MRRAVLSLLLLAGCAPGLSSPSRFEDASVCSEDVQNALLVRRCARRGCHVPFEPASGVEFLSGGLEARLVGVRSATCPTTLLIDPVSPANSHLLARISPNPTCEGVPIDRMPRGGMLSDAEIECVRAWVERIAREQAP
jgi:hypothetical protein